MVDLAGDTIFAQATAVGRAGVAIVRVSGPQAVDTLVALSGNPSAPHRTSLQQLYCRDGSLLDHAVVIFFPEGGSFTGEDVVEYHLHGSVAIIQRMFRELGAVEGCRFAEAGEFTRRALENDCLDLAQVEGLADLIESETEAQRRQALRVFDGALGRIVDQWRRDLIRAGALIEATIDFVDEDVPVDVYPEVSDLLSKTRDSLLSEIDGARVAERVRDGFEVAIVGRPNVGKSTLLNFLAGRDAAITSEFAGTTRDVIECRMDLAGYPVTLLDTAGIRESSDKIETLGIEWAKKRASRADIRIFLVENSQDDLEIPRQEGDIVVLSKGDIREKSLLAISGLTGAGVDELVLLLEQRLKDLGSGSGNFIRERHILAMTSALENIDVALEFIADGVVDAEIIADEIAQSLHFLDSLIGRVGVEDFLGEIFSSFCIGK